MAAPADTRPRRRRRGEAAAIGALAGGATFGDAATAAGIGERTVRRWWAEDPAFRSQVGALQAEALDRAAGILADRAADAATRIAAIALEPSSVPPRVRLAAARAVVDLASRLRSRDLEERVAALEERIGGGGGW